MALSSVPQSVFKTVFEPQDDLA